MRSASFPQPTARWWESSQQFGNIRYLPLKQGRWLNRLDDGQRRNVIVLGDELTRNLFPGRPAVGASIIINGLSFEVIGSIQRVGRGDNNSTNMRGYIPYRVMATYFPIKEANRENAISFINYRPKVTREHLLAQEDVRKIIARNHGFDYRDENAFEDWDTVKQPRRWARFSTRWMCFWAAWEW